MRPTSYLCGRASGNGSDMNEMNELNELNGMGSMSTMNTMNGMNAMNAMSGVSDPSPNPIDELFGLQFSFEDLFKPSQLL